MSSGEETGANEATAQVEEVALYDIENERILLGGLIIKPEIYHFIREEIDAEAFIDPIHRRIFAALDEAIGTGESDIDRQIKPAVLIEAIGGPSDNPILAGMTPQAYIASLAAGTHLAEDFRGIARYLRNLADQRNEDFSEADDVSIVIAEPESVFGALKWEDIDRPGEELRQIIDGWFTVSDMSIVAGPSQSGKSFLMIHAAFVIALHAVRDQLPEHVRDKLPDFFGHRVLEPGLVIYQAGEGARGVKNRLRALRRYFQIPADLHIPFVLLTRKVDLYRQGDAGDVKKLIKEINGWHVYYNLPLAMTVFDTWATATPGADENSAKDMTAALSNCETVKRSTGGHVALVHHMNAGGSKVRGHSSIYANMDQVVLVTRDAENKIRTAKLDKQKDDEGGKVIHFELKSVVLGKRAIDGKDITSCVCLDVGEKDREKIARDSKAFNPSGREAALLRALFKALKEKPIATGSLKIAAPTTVTYVVKSTDLREDFANEVFPGEDPEGDSRVSSRVRSAMSTAATSLRKFNVIANDGKFLWWAGRPVKGFRQTYKEDETRAPEAPLPDDIDDFLRS